MKENVSEAPSTTLPAVAEASPKQKLPYSRPTLTEFGSVSKLTMTGSGTGSDGGTTAGMQMVSDRRAKESIVRVGDHPLGIGLYLFEYKPHFRASCGEGRYLGVMADEVELVMPQAVVVHADGYKMVDYGKLMRGNAPELP